MQNNQNNNDYIKEFAEDPAIFDICENIGKKFGLFIDQVGDLDMEVRKILLGKSKSEDLIDNISKILEINKSSAGQIVEEINKQIFSTLKSKMQSQSAYITSLGNTQMNANTYPQSFKPINTINTTQQPLPPKTESPHADLEKAGGFTIEVAGNPLPNIEKPKPQPVEIPKTQQPLPPNLPIVEEKNETIGQSFQPANYYNFKNNPEIENKVEDKKEEIAEKEKDIENKPEVEEEEVSNMEEKTIVPGKIVFKHVSETEIKKPEPETEVKNEEIIKPVEKTEPIQNTETKNPEIQVTETIKPIETTEPIEVAQTTESQKPLAEYLVSKMNDKSTVPDNLPVVEETPKPTETIKETVVTPVANEIKLAPAPKPVIENKPRAFDPYREIPS